MVSFFWWTFSRCSYTSKQDQHAENPPPYSVSADGVQFTNVSTLSSPTRSTAGAGLAVVTRSSSEPGPAEIRRIPPSPTDSSSASGTFVDAPNALPVPPKSSKGYPPNPIASSSSALADNRYFNENSNSSSSALPMDTPPSPIPAPADAPPTSFVHMRKFNRSVTGKFVLDPRFPRPPGTRMGLEKARSDPIDDDVCLPAWEDDGPGGPGASVDPNMLLECKNGNIDADVWILGAKAGEGEENVKARLDVLDKNGFVFVKVVRLPSLHTIHATQHANDGFVNTAYHRRFLAFRASNPCQEWRRPARHIARFPRPAHDAHAQRLDEHFASARASVSGLQRGEWHAKDLCW